MENNSVILHRNLFSGSILSTLGFWGLANMLVVCSAFASTQTGFSIRQVFDAQLNASEQATDTSPLVGQAVAFGQPIVTGEGSRVEIATDAGVLMRLGSRSRGHFTQEGECVLDSGSALIHLPQGEVLAIQTPKAEFGLRGGAGYMLEITGNGGAKVICFYGNGEIALGKPAEIRERLREFRRIKTQKMSDKSSPNEQVRSLIPGTLQFIVADKAVFGPYTQIDLDVLSASSLLLHGFTQTYPHLKQVETAAFTQSYKIKGHTNALVGDAKDEKNFEMIIIHDEVRAKAKK